MSAWLAGLLVALAEKLLAAFGQDVEAWWAKREAQKAIDDAAARSVQKLKAAKTGKEIDDAADDAINGV